MTDAQNDRKGAAPADGATRPVENPAATDGVDGVHPDAADVARTDAAPAAAADTSLSGPAATASETVTSETVRVRRTPRYARFMLVGALVCVVAAFILTYSLPQGAGYDRNTVFGFMLLVAIAVGVALGSIAALIADRVARRRARTVTADRIDVRTSRADAPSDGRDL